MNAVIRRCGECFWGRLVPQDFTQRVCYGAPPTPMLMPPQRLPDKPGQVTMQINMARPVVRVSDDACAQFKERLGAPIDDRSRIEPPFASKSNGG